MQGLTRLVSLLALCAAVSLTACKDDGNPSSTPAADATPPPAAPATPSVPAAGDAPVAESAGPVDPAGGANVACTPDTRKGGVCTREFHPVCGTLADNTARTFSNKCVACSDEKVVRYVDGACPGDPPA